MTTGNVCKLITAFILGFGRRAGLKLGQRRNLV